MPTGFTAPVYEGKSIDAMELASNFARGMGFTIHQRDEHHSSPPRKRSPSSYYAKRVPELEAERAYLLDMDEEAAEAEYQVHIDEVNSFNEKSRRDWSEMRKRYLDAIRVFNQWKPRTESGQKVRDFALRQLREAMDFDARPAGPFLRSVLASNPGEYITQRLADNAKSLDRAREHLYDEEVRCEEANRWIDDFYADAKLLEGIRLNDDNTAH